MRIAVALLLAGLPGLLPPAAAARPGRLDLASATSVQVERATEASGIDLAVPRSHGARVHGVALAASGAGLTGSVLVAMPVAAQVATTRLRILAAADASPLRRAKVVVVANGRAAAPVFSADDGQVDVGDVSAATVLEVSKSGYAPQSLRLSGRLDQPIDIRLTLAAVITGRVVDSQGQPAVRFGLQIRHVDPTTAPQTVAAARTDDRGEFRVGNLVAGRYELAIERGPGAAPASSSDIVAVTAEAGEQADVVLTLDVPSVEFPFSEGGVVTGTLVDDYGEPAEGVGVTLRAIGASGMDSMAAPTTVDDTGRFRIFHVAPGRYLMVVTSGPAPGLIAAGRIVRIGGGDPATLAYLPVYYPGRLDPAEAVPLVIERARELHGIDMVVPMVRGARVFGVVSAAPADQPSPVLLRPVLGSAAAVLGVPSATVTPAGTFELKNVPPGAYSVQYLSPAVYDRPTETTDFRFAASRIVVAGDDVGPLALSPAPTSAISGRIVLEGDRQGVSPNDFALAVLPADPSEAPDGRLVNGATRIVGGTAPDSNWTFRIAGLAARARLSLAKAPQGWWLKSVDIGGINAAVEPAEFGSSGDSRDDVEIVLSRSAGTVAGRAVDASGQPLDLYTVIAFSPDRDLWFEGSPYVKTTTSRSGGDFLLSTLTPGPYLIAAVEYSELDPAAEEILQADALARLAVSAQRVIVGERQPQRVELRLGRSVR